MSHPPTLTPTEADRHLDAAERRWRSAQEWHDANARTAARHLALAGSDPLGAIYAENYLIARAAELEAHADWDDARRLRARVRNAAMFEGSQGRWVA